MTAHREPPLRTLAFGDHELGIWAAAWIAVPSGPAFLALGSGGHVRTPPARLGGSGESEVWELRAEGVEVTLAPVGPAARPADSGGFDQLCRAGGRMALGRAEHERLDCLGVRTARTNPVDLERAESMRAVSAWFEPGEGLALLALRPRESAGHERDLVTASVLDQEEPSPVAEPRLSTTYGREGLPARVGFEFWMGDDQDDQPYPRRAAGEAAGSHATALLDRFQFDAVPLRIHSRGRDGAGVYLLARHG
jgi:hypothetical protein